MKHKNTLFFIIACLAVGSFLTALAFTCDMFAGANSIAVENYINEPENEGGVPFLEEMPEEISEEPSEESTEPSEETSKEANKVSSAESKEPSREESKPESKPGPQDAPEHSTPSAVPEVSSRPDSKPESKEPSVESKEPSKEESKEPPTPSEPPVTSEPESDITVKVKVSGEAVEMSALDAISKIVEGEMGSSFSVEALKAQAVAAYTYVKYQNKSGNTPSLPMRNPSDKVKSAVASVLGEAIYYNGSYAFTPYHATSSGRTNSSAEVWGGSYSYLTNVESAYDPTASYKNRETVIDMETVKTKTENYLGITLDESNPEGWFEITDANRGGYVQKMTVTDINGNSQTITGRKLRENILEYALKSHAFTFTYSNGNFIFITNGYGHGVGMSQTGANGYANNEGWTYRDILLHYYPGTSIK